MRTIILVLLLTISQTQIVLSQQSASKLLYDEILSGIESSETEDDPKTKLIKLQDAQSKLGTLVSKYPNSPEAALQIIGDANTIGLDEKVKTALQEYNEYAKKKKLEIAGVLNDLEVDFFEDLGRIEYGVENELWLKIVDVVESYEDELLKELAPKRNLDLKEDLFAKVNDVLVEAVKSADMEEIERWIFRLSLLEGSNDLIDMATRKLDALKSIKTLEQLAHEGRWGEVSVNASMVLEEFPENLLSKDLLYRANFELGIEKVEELSEKGLHEAAWMLSVDLKSTYSNELSAAELSMSKNDFDEQHVMLGNLLSKSYESDLQSGGLTSEHLKKIVKFSNSDHLGLNSNLLQNLNQSLIQFFNTPGNVAEDNFVKRVSFKIPETRAFAGDGAKYAFLSDKWSLLFVHRGGSNRRVEIYEVSGSKLNLLSRHTALDGVFIELLDHERFVVHNGRSVYDASQRRWINLYQKFGYSSGPTSLIGFDVFGETGLVGDLGFGTGNGGGSNYSVGFFDLVTDPARLNDLGLEQSQFILEKKISVPTCCVFDSYEETGRVYTVLKDNISSPDTIIHELNVEPDGSLNLSQDYIVRNTGQISAIKFLPEKEAVFLKALQTGFIVSMQGEPKITSFPYNARSYQVSTTGTGIVEFGSSSARVYSLNKERFVGNVGATSNVVFASYSADSAAIVLTLSDGTIEIWEPLNFRKPSDEKRLERVGEGNNSSFSVEKTKMDFSSGVEALGDVEVEEALKLNATARREIQRRLLLLGFDPNGVDGVFGPGSRGAISKWQMTNGYIESGFVDQGQIDLLKKQSEALYKNWVVQNPPTTPKISKSQQRKQLDIRDQRMLSIGHRWINGQWCSPYNRCVTPRYNSSCNQNPALCQ